LFLNTIRDPFLQYNLLGPHSKKVLLSKEEEEQLWLRRIFAALADKGYILKYKAESNGYYIQA
jgi:hypothetical protein